MGAKRVVRIGQKAFVLSPNGEVVRTVVAKLEGEGYQFLNGDSNHHSHWFFFKEAVAAASAGRSRRKTIATMS